MSYGGSEAFSEGVHPLQKEVVPKKKQQRGLLFYLDLNRVNVHVEALSIRMRLHQMIH